MVSMTRRRSFAALAALLATPAMALAQGATNAPPGGIPSTTAPSNSQGTPAGGTGMVGGARPPAGGPVGSTPNTPLVGGEMGTSETAQPRRRRRRHRRARHTTAQ